MTLHGSDYATVDTDLAVSAEAWNSEPIVKALAPFRPHPHNTTVDGFVWDGRSIFGAVISLVTDLGDVDLLRILPGVDSFEGLWNRATTLRIEDVDVRVASLEDLIAMKRAADRPKDRNHIIELEALKRLRER